MSANNSLFGTFISDSRSSRELFWKVLKVSTLVLPFLVTLSLYRVISKHWVDKPEGFMFSLSVSFIALILAGIYYFSYQYFTENFYYFIFVSWLANAIYLIPELNGPDPHKNWSASFKLAVTGLSVLSIAFLAVALFTRASAEGSKTTWEDIDLRTRVFNGVVAILYIPIAEFTLNRFYSNDPKIVVAAWVLVPTSAASYFLIWAVGYSLKSRLRPSSSKGFGRLLFGSFLAYALLQLLYPFILFWQNLLPLFLVAQLAKVVNAIAMTGALQSAMVHKQAMQAAQLDRAAQEVEIKAAQLAAQEEKIKSEENFVQLGKLASAIKHDVITPLATMGFDLRYLQQQFMHENRITRRVESLNQSKDRIEAIVKIVDIFRGDKAFFDRDRFMAKASMLEIAHRAVRSVKNERPDLKLNNATIRITIEGRDVWVRAYVPMLEQVLVNVIKNGIEAIEEAERDSGLITVSVGTTKRPNTPYSRWVKVDVEDNGCGIPPENIDRLTSIFTTRGDRKPNSGIGLFIGNRILEIHHGEFQFNSTVGEGTVVTLLLPELKALEKIEGTTSDGNRNTQKTAENVRETNEIDDTQDPSENVLIVPAEEQLADNEIVGSTAELGEEP